MIRSPLHPLAIALPLWLAAAPALTQPAAVMPGASSAASPNSYERLIAGLRDRPDALGVEIELSEAYAGLGNSLQAEQRHEEAVAAYEEALQLLREGRGLHAIEQLPVLQARLASNQALEAWRAVDEDRHLAFRIAAKNPGAEVAPRYQALRELGLWKLRAADENLLPDALEGAREAAELYRQELEHPGARESYRGLALANLWLDLAALEFLQARKKLALPLSAYVEGGQRTVTEMYCETILMPNGQARQVCRNLQVPNMDYFLSLSDRKYRAAWEHLDAMEEAVLEAYAVLLPEVETQNRDKALALLAEVHSLTGAFNDFVARNSRRAGSRIAAPTGSRINR